MKKIVAIVLALVLLAAIGATAYAMDPSSSVIYKPNFAVVTGEQEYESDDFAVGSRVVEETAAEDGVNPDTGLHFGF